MSMKLIAACAAGVLAAMPAAASITVSPVALSGTDGVFGPGLGAGVTFTAIDQQLASINLNGQVAFRGTISSAGTPQGLFVRSGGINSNVALAGGAAPGGGTYTSGSTGVFNSYSLNSAGQWTLRMGASNATFTNAGGTARRVLGTGDVAPGTNGATISSLQSVSPLANDTNGVGVLADLTSGSGTPGVVVSGATANARGLWLSTPSNTTLVVRQNDTVPALDPSGNVRMGQIQNLSVAMNDNNAFAFVANVQGTGVVTGTGAGSNSAALFTNRNGSMEMLARQGSAAPTATGAASSTDLFRTISSSAFGFNNQGRVAFVSSLRDAAGTQTSSASLFTDTGSGVMREVARNGAALPAINGAIGSEFAGVTWGSVTASPRINSQGTLALITSLGNVGTGGTNVIMTMSPADQFTRIVRTGDIAVIDGAPLGGNALFNTFSNLAINSIGQLTFSTTLSGAGVIGGPGGNNQALFAYDPVVGLNMLARTGDLFTVAPGDVRTISSIGGTTATGGQDGRSRSLNDDGRVVFQLSFVDGSSGLFVATIPTAGTLPGLALAGLVLARRRR
ncbi:MAG TPA: choice-of-anchor tandem repeat NxxGxxAF-containing protein [Phycisphaerales bacterium]|nr:choice-of-anchor tandem repeat NxxGxxAF-containing protein [Phycisphaerales bacterium]